MSVGSRGASCSDVTTGSTGPAAGGKGDDSTVTQSQTTGSDATSGAAADCSMATDSSEAGDSPRDYNKMKYHSSKMDLNLMILRDQMTNLQSSGSSLSRQLASMYRNLKEIKDDDEGEDADSEYESEDEQIARDAVDTEDDVNKMSDLEKDYSEPKLRRSVSTGSSRGKKAKNGARELSNAIEVTTSDGGHRRHSKSNNSVDGSGESYQDSDSECSQCLCCNSIASYSSTPWRYVSRGEGSTMDEESDSSEYFSDESEYSTTTCTSIPYDVNKQQCAGEDTDEGRFEDAEPVADLRMSPVGCESPRKCNSQPDLRSLLVRSESITKDTPKSVKPGTEAQAPTTTEEEQAEAIKASSLIGIFKEQEAKAKQDQMATIAKAKRVEELRRKNSEIRLQNEKKRKAEMESRMKEKTKQGTKTSPLAADNEEIEKMNIRDRISTFEKQKKEESKESSTDAKTKPNTETVKSKNVEKGTNTESDVGTSVQQMPDVIPDVTEGKNEQGDVDDHDKVHRSRRPKSKIAKTTIEIPVSCLPDQVVHPQSGTAPDQPTMMTFQVRPVDIEAVGGPMLVARSPKPKRKTSKTIVRLSSTESPPMSVSEATLVSDSNTVKISGTAGKKPSGHSHSVCPHCQKKSKPGESKRVMKVLQLQPVPESPDMPPMSPVQRAEESAHIIQQQPDGGQIIKMIPTSANKHSIVQRQESSSDGVVFRFNMGIPENAPLQVGDYIRIPIQPQQPKIRHQGGGVVIRTGGHRRPNEVIQFSQSPPGVIVQPSQSPSSGGGVTVHMGQPGVRVMPSKGGGVKLVFGS
ncbi:uncharacterized protein [Asterias amurensis]|uniref:uncharacterized protein n=1 Tax=Asterias amurensis TaxID=7602 RepID=UPI003AB3F856